MFLRIIIIYSRTIYSKLDLYISYIRNFRLGLLKTSDETGIYSDKMCQEREYGYLCAWGLQVVN